MSAHTQLTAQSLSLSHIAAHSYSLAHTHTARALHSFRRGLSSEGNNIEQQPTTRGRQWREGRGADGRKGSVL